MVRYGSQKRADVGALSPVSWSDGESLMRISGKIIFNFINYFKLKASFGQMGNDRVDAFQYLTRYAFDNRSCIWIRQTL